MKFTISRPIVCDVESFYSKTCSVKSDNKNGWPGGPWHYSWHPEFYCYLISFVDLETGVSGVLDDPAKFPEFIESTRGRTFVAHNALFDYAVFKRIVPSWEPLNTVDTADCASYLQCSRSLLDSCKYLLRKDIDKSARDFMNGRHWATLTEAEKQRLRDYALSDSINEAELYRLCVPQMPEIELWASDYTRRQNWTGVHVDVTYLEEQMDKVSAVRAGAKSKIPWAEDHPPTSPKQLAVYCREMGILPPASMAEDSDECVEWERQYGSTFPVVAAIRDYRKSNTLLKKLMLLQSLVRPDGTAPLASKYAAAPHTLRWSATGFNFQSLPRKSDMCDLRGCLIPPPGHVFIGSDLAGIECRVLEWLAGDYEYLQAVAKLDDAARAEGEGETGDLYEPAARKMFNYSDPRPLKKTDKDLRNATKTCVLQLGYQSSAAKFDWYMRNNVEKRVLDRIRQGTETDYELAVRLVKLYRDSNPKVTNLWWSLDRELREACTMGKDFVVEQPNGRKVYYRDLAVRAAVKPDGSVRNEVVGRNCMGDDRVKLYGGKIVENISQECARHVFLYAMRNLSDAGFYVNFSVHDEHCLCVPEAQATPETKAHIEAIMSQTPPWAPGLPLAAETTVMKRYAK